MNSALANRLVVSLPSRNTCLQGHGKKWEHYDLNQNGKPLRVPMHVQRGDMVQIISGAEKGKTGKITNVMHQLPVKLVSDPCFCTHDCITFAGHNKDRANCCRRGKPQGIGCSAATFIASANLSCVHLVACRL